MQYSYNSKKRFFNVYQFIWVLLSLSVLRVGCGIRLEVPHRRLKVPRHRLEIPHLEPEFRIEDKGQSIKDDSGQNSLFDSCFDPDQHVLSSVCVFRVNAVQQILSD